MARKDAYSLGPIMLHRLSGGLLYPGCLFRIRLFHKVDSCGGHRSILQKGLRVMNTREGRRDAPYQDMAEGF